MKELRDIYALLDTATGPDRELSNDIIRSLISVYDRDAADFYGSGDNYTDSIDAALALVERVLPVDENWAKDSPPSSGWRIYLYRGLTVDQWECCIRPHGIDGKMFDASTAPLAILKALVAILIEKESS